MFQVGVLSQAPIFIVVDKLSPRQLEISQAFFTSRGSSFFKGYIPKFGEDFFQFELPENLGFDQLQNWMEAVQILIGTLIEICNAADKTNPSTE